jgi:hypothetical protein
MELGHCMWSAIERGIGTCLSLISAQDNRDRFAEAIHKDIAKPKVQVELLEVLCVANEVSTPRLFFMQFWHL